MRRFIAVFVSLVVGGTIAWAAPGAGPVPASAAVPAPTAQATAPVLGRFFPLPSSTVASDLLVPANGTAEVAVAGIGPVPAEAIMVSANLSARSTGGGSLTVAPKGTSASGTTQASYRPGLTARVALTVGLGQAGRITVTNTGAATVTVTFDVQGYARGDAAPGGSVYQPIPPSDLVNNRTVAAGATYRFNPLGEGGVPATGVTGVLLSIFASAPAAGPAGHGTFYPSDGTDPGTPHVEYVVNDYGSNEVIVRPGADGQVIFHNKSTVSTTIYLTVSGYFTAAASTAGTLIVPVGPKRLASGLTAPARGSVTVAVAGVAGLPASDVAAACLHLTVESATGPASLGGMRYQAGPDASTMPVLTRLSSGKATFSHNGSSSVTFSVDVSCYYQTTKVPEPPLAVLAQPGDAAVTVSWQAAPSDGGAPVTAYVVSSVPGARTVTVPGTATTATVGALTNGVGYRFAVRAVNSVGTSAPAASELVIPTRPNPPGAPFVTSVYPRDGAVRVTWSPPDTGPGSVVGYQVTATPGGAMATAGPEQNEAIVTGLANGTTYTFTVTAHNAIGRGAASTPSEPVVPSPADAPLEPAALLTVPLDRRIDVQWVAPADGGTPVTSYQVTAEPGGHSVTVARDSTVTALTRLTNGTAYTVRVVARNAAGSSPPAERTGVTPAAARPPAVPTDVRAGVTGQGEVQVRWNAPVDPGTSAITGYAVTVTPGGTVVSANATSATVSGLDPATAYRFTVAARNAAGAGPQSQPTSEVSPRVTVKATPKVLTSAESATLQLVRTDGALVFEQPPPGISTLPAGTVVILQAHALAPSGLFRRVTGVTLQGGLVIVATVPAALTEVFDEASMAAVTEVGDQDVAEFIAESPHIRRKQPTLKGRTLDQGARSAGTAGVEIGLRSGHVVAEVTMSINDEGTRDPLRPPSNSPPVGGRLEAQIDLDPRLDNDIDISLGGVETSHHVSVNYVTQFRAKFGYLKEAEFTLPGAKIRARCFNIQVGPVPVIICLDFNIKPTITVNGSMGVTAAVTFGRVVGAEMATRNGTVVSHRGINEPNGRQASDLEAYADANIVLGLPLETTVYFYNAAGPGLVIRPYLHLKLDSTQDPWWELRAGVSVGIFFKTREFFGHQIEFTRDDVVNFFVTVAHSGGPFKGLRVTPKESEIRPGATVQLHAEPVLYPPEIPIRWRLVSGPGEVDGSGLFRSALAGNAVVEAYSPAGPLTGDKELKQRASIAVAGTSVPSAPREVTATAKPLAVELTWQPPATDGNLNLTRYAIVSSPTSQTTYTDGGSTRATVGFLTPGVAYTFQVFAVNADGSGDPSAPTAPVTPHEAVQPGGPVVNLAVDAAGNPDNSHTAGEDGFLVSGNGRYVFFTADASSNLMPPEVSEAGGFGTYVLRKDRFTGEIVVASRGLDGRTPTRGYLVTRGIEDRIGATSFDGSVVAYSIWLNYPGRHGQDLVVHNFATQTTTPITGRTPDAPEVTHSDLRMSRDGSVLTFLATHPVSPWRHIFVSLDGGEPRRVSDCIIDIPCTDPPHGAYDLTGDGRTIYYAESDGRGGPDRYSSGVLRYDVATATTTILSPIPGPEQRITTPTVVVSGNGELLAGYHRWWDDGDGPGPVRDEGLVLKRLPASGLIDWQDIVFRSPGALRYPVGISDDGKVVAIWEALVDSWPGSPYGRDTRYAYVYDVTAGTLIPVMTDPSRWIDRFAISTDATVAVWTAVDWATCEPVACGPTDGVWARSLA